MNCELMLTYDTPALRQTGSRNLTGPKTLPTIWSTNMKLVTKYQIRVINSCWEKCDEKCAYMLNVYKSQLSRQTGSRNLTVKKKHFPQNGVPIWSLWRNIRFLPSIFAEKNATKYEHIYMFNVYKNQQIQQTGIKVIIFWLENGKFEFSRKQYIFLKHIKREFCAEFYYHF
jgi:hypothetical protein